MKKAGFFSLLLFVLISCESSQKKTTIIEPLKSEALKKNYISISSNKEDTIFTNKPISLDTSLNSIEDEETVWKTNSHIRSINRNLPGNEFKINLIRKNKFSIDTGYFYKTEKNKIPEKPVDVIDTGRRITVIEPDQKKLLAPNFKDNAQYNIWCLGPDQGLSSRNIYSIIKDDKGFMWFGTDNGLIRYDGTNAKTYTTKNGLPDNKIKIVRKDKKGNLWLGTEESGIVKFDGKTFHHYSLDSIAPKRVISDIEIDENGDLWCTITFGGLLYFDGKTFHSYKEKQGMLVERPTSSISIDKNGRKWITGYGQGLYTLTDKGLFCLNKPNNIDPGYIHSSFIDNTNKLYLGVFGKIYCVIDKDTVSYYEIPHNKSEGFVSMVQDKQGNIWGAADVGGIYKLGDTSATHIDQRQGISSDILYTMYVDDLGKIWIGTEGGGVCCFDPESSRALNTSRGSIVNYYNHVVELKDGGYIIGTDNGVNYYKDTTMMQFTDFEKNGISTHNIIKTCPDLVVDNKGSIYVTLLNGGVYRFNKNGNDFTGIRKEGMHINQLNIELLRNGDKWIGGMEANGFFKNKSNTKIYIHVKAKFPF